MWSKATFLRKRVESGFLFCKTVRNQGQKRKTMLEIHQRESCNVQCPVCFNLNSTHTITVHKPYFNSRYFPLARSAIIYYNITKLSISNSSFAGVFVYFNDVTAVDINVTSRRNDLRSRYNDDLQ